VTVGVSTIAVAVSTICTVFVSTICAVFVSTTIVAVDPSLEDGIGVGIAIFGMKPSRTSTLANPE
jgi:hypothetical protein